MGSFPDTDIDPKSVSLTDIEVQTLLEEEENQYTKRKTLLFSTYWKFGLLFVFVVISSSCFHLECTNALFDFYSRIADPYIFIH